MNVSNSLFCSLIGLFISSLALAQQANPAATNNQKGKGIIEKIYGKIVDGSTNKSVEFASVGLFKMPKDSTVAVALTAPNGDFSFDNIPYGTYLLRVKYLGYKMLEKEMSLDANNLKNDIGNIGLEPDATVLNEIEVVEEKESMSMSIDRKVFNVSKDLSVAGGTGLDAVKNIPSVTVDMDGTVTLRNSEVQIYIDGKQSNLSLDQIPADQIDRIEIMSNPSAKYDANTSGGLLNVVMKKNLKPGYNGSVVAGIGTNERYMPSVNLNVKKEPFNLTTMYSYNSESNDNKGRTTRDNKSNPVPIQHFEQSSLSDFIRKMHVANVSLDYTINNRNTISIGEKFVDGTYRTLDDQNFTSYDTASTIYSIGKRDNENTNHFKRYNSQLNYKKTFPKKGMELSADVNYNYGTSAGNYTFNTVNTISETAVSTTEIQKNNANGNSQQGIFQMDFTNPLNDSSKIELGIKSSYNKSRNTNSTTNFSSIANEFAYDSALSNDYQVTEMVNAAYINYTRKIKKINIQAGLRFEQVQYTGAVLNKSDETFGYTYPANLSNIMTSLFPAIYLSKKRNAEHEFQLNFSRKLNRPRFYYLMPIVFFADKFNYRIGNPALQPEFVNKAEINYNYVKPSFNYLTALYGQITENAILYGAYPSADDANVLVNTFQNGGTSYTLGWENIARITSLKNLTISATLTPYFISVNYIDRGTKLKSEGFSLNSKLLVSYKFPKDVTLQVNGMYEAPKPIPQGYKTDLYFFDMSLSKKIKKSFLLNLTLSDVLNTKQRGTVYSTADYDQYLIRRRHSRFLKFSVTWMFGKTENKQKPNISYDE